MTRLVLPVLFGLLCASSALATEVLLVQGTLSAPDPAERNYAKRLTEACHRWLSDLHVPNRVTTDELISSRLLEGARVVVLVYNPYPPKRMLELLTAFVARGGKIIALATVGDSAIADVAHDVVLVPDVHELFQPIVASIPLQLFAYHVADLKGTDVDQPRNLAKSVTVE